MVVCGVVLSLAVLMWIACKKRLTKDRKKILGVVLAAALIGMLEGVSERDSSVLVEGNRLERNAYGEGGYEQEMELEVEGYEDAFSYKVTVPEQILTLEEEQQYLAAAGEELRQVFLGENASVNCIRGSVVVRDSYQEGRVTAEWYFADYDIVDMKGNIIAEDLPKEGVLTSVQVNLSCGTSSSIEEFYFRVFPLEQSEQEKLLGQLTKALRMQGSKSGEQYLSLPERIGEYRLEWKTKNEHKPEQILLFGVIIATFIPLLEHSQKQEREKKRQRMLELAYPDIVSKMALLLSAGMTPQGAFKRIAHAYEEKRKTHAISEMPAYEEMLITWREMESGTGEQRAYERFGERCGLPEYRKFGNILAQNLRKGSQGVVALLEQEVENAFEERKSTAKRYGEEAGTKLLFPMMLMLGIVLIILIVPAMAAFSL